LKVPADGCVTTTFLSAKILPPPSGISEVFASSAAPPPPPVVDDCAPPPGGVPVDGEDPEGCDDAVEPEPEPEPPQAASAAARPAVPAAATTVRLVVCVVESVVPDLSAMVPLLRSSSAFDLKP
jgi:hypothetical protein